MGMRKTCMCGLDWGFTTCWIRGRDFYGRTDRPKIYVKQIGQS